MPRVSYRSYAELESKEQEGADYRIIACPRQSPVAVIAPHGGSIEPGTSELARRIAGQEFSLYCFEGLRRNGNVALHITSTHFDEPSCLAIVGASDIVLSVHGSEEPAEVVHIGGRDERLAGTLRDALAAAGFAARRDDTEDHGGRLARNICNRGASGQGCQLEISKSLRHTLFQGLRRRQREHPTEQFHLFVGAVRGVLLAAIQ
jgi:phage replication-related protein YjqB (UPF0714/DUF867 family)